MVSFVPASVDTSVPPAMATPFAIRTRSHRTKRLCWPPFSFCSPRSFPGDELVAVVAASRIPSASPRSTKVILWNRLMTSPLCALARAK